jgi:hypothetical protein
VGGSTIYLGDSVSIKADNQGALTVTNNAGTVNLVTPTGITGGTLSGIGTATTNGDSIYGTHVFSSPFAYPPIVVASINNVAALNAKLYIPKESVTETECRIYSDMNGATYNWIATARTEYPFEFYNEATPITEVSVTASSLVLSVNTSQLLRGGLPPYTDVEMRAFTGGGNPDITSVPITMYTGVQTITVDSLQPAETYSIYIAATDSSGSAAISSNPQDFTTAAAPLVAAVIALGTITEENRTNSQLPYDITTPASGGSGSLTEEWQYKESSVSWPGSPSTFVDNLLTVTVSTTYNVRVKTIDGAGSTVYSNTVTATLYATLTIGDGSVSPPGQEVDIGQVVTINIATGNLFDGGIGPYSFVVNDLTQSPANFILNLTDSDIVGNTVGITSTTYSFSEEQTTYLTSDSKTLVYKWTSSGDVGQYPYYLELTSGDGQTYSNTSSPFTFTLVEPAPG